MKVINDNSTGKRCPYCKAAVKHKGPVEFPYGIRREGPTTFVCGTVTSPNWNPPIKGDNCCK